MFIKLFTQILDSSIADNRPLRHFFTDLLLCADMRGYVMMTETAIARRIGATLEEVQHGIAELEGPDPRSKTPDHDGARIERLEGVGYGWRIINFETYKMMKSAEDLREKTNERVRRFREKHKETESCNVTVTPCNAGNTIKRQRKSEIKNEKQPTSTPTAPSAKARPTSQEEVETFFAEIDLTKQDAEWFWLKHEENGWTRAQGKQKVKDWKLHARSWKSKGGIFPSQDRQFHAKTSNGKPNHAENTHEGTYF
jgi:hypothetical protein